MHLIWTLELITIAFSTYQLLLFNILILLNHDSGISYSTRAIHSTNFTYSKHITGIIIIIFIIIIIAVVVVVTCYVLVSINKYVEYRVRSTE